MSHGAPPPLILASTSAYRRALLERLRVPFDCVPPEADEAPLPGEAAAATAQRLARAKAAAVAAHHPGAVVIGSDQVAVRGVEVLGKPGSVERCTQQLRQSSGQEVDFLTAVHVIDGARSRSESHLDCTRVLFRSLEPGEIARYVATDAPLDCAGGFKAESLGQPSCPRPGSAPGTAAHSP